MTTYVQRQFSAFLGNGSNTDPVMYGVANRLWTSQDVYPAKILKLASGEAQTVVLFLNVDSAGTVSLPSGYVSTSKLMFTLSTDSTVKVVTVSPDHPTSTVLVKAATGQNGLFSFVGTVTSIVVTNESLTATATVIYNLFEYPDITDPDSWRDGTQTTGSFQT